MEETTLWREAAAMQWDLGFEGLAVLGLVSIAFGVFAGLAVGGAAQRRLFAVVITTVACFGVGLVTSEGIFGWATEEDLQPNIDGLSRDEVLLSSVLTTLVIVLVMRSLVHRNSSSRVNWHAIGRHRRGHSHA